MSQRALLPKTSFLFATALLSTFGLTALAEDQAGAGANQAQAQSEQKQAGQDQNAQGQNQANAGQADANQANAGQGQDQQNQNSQQADSAQQGQQKQHQQPERLVGTWKLVSYKYGTAPAFTDFPSEHTQLKHVTPTHFTWVRYDDKGKLEAAGGGTYRRDANGWTEHVEFALGQEFQPMIGQDQTFTTKREGNRIHNTATLPSGFKIEEIWERVGGDDVAQAEGQNQNGQNSGQPSDANQNQAATDQNAEPASAKQSGNGQQQQQGDAAQQQQGQSVPQADGRTQNGPQ